MPVNNELLEMAHSLTSPYQYVGKYYRQPTVEMCADIGTKNLAVAQFIKLRDFVTGYHFAKVIFEQRVSGDAQISKTFWSGLYKRVTEANPPDGSTSKHPPNGSASKHQKKRR